jgi:Glycosyl transferase family 2
MIWGVSSTRDEDDIVGASTRHMLAECDHVIIENHCSTDGTAAILARLAEQHPRLHLYHDPDPVYDQASTMNELVAKATAQGATWVVPFDTDEVWTSPQGLLRDVLPTVADDCVEAVVYEHVPRPHDRGANPLLRMKYRRERPWDWAKVAIRTGRGLHLSAGQHGAGGASVARSVVVVRHFPYRSVEQAHRRVARNAVAAGHAGDTWQYGGLHQQFQKPALFAEWWSGLTSPEGLVYDPAPVRG